MSCDKTCASVDEFFRWEVDSTGGVIIAAFIDDKASSVDVPSRRNTPGKMESASTPLTETQRKRSKTRKNGVRAVGISARTPVSACVSTAFVGNLRFLLNDVV